MKKHFLKLGAGIFFLLPLYGYADELPTIKLATSATSSSLEETVFGTTTASTTGAWTFTTCSQEAIEARDTKIAQARGIYNTAMANALTERKNREKAAVAIMDESDKKDAIKTSVETYKAQAKSAQGILVQARKMAWQTFENDIKKCHDQQDQEMTLQNTEAVSVTETQAPMMMRKMEKSEKTLEKSIEKVEEKDTKTIKETIKAQFESLKSLFN